MYKINESIIHSVELKTSNFCETYALVSCDILFSVQHKHFSESANLQTGHSFIMNNYSLASNELSVYASNSNLLETLDKLCESDIDYEIAQVFNEIYKLNFSVDDYISIYKDIRDVITEAKHIVNEEERFFLEAFESDTRAFVEQQYKDQNNFQCDLSDYYEFDTEEEADAYISENKNAYHCSKEDFYIQLNK